ncbi:MAG: SpoIIE family protein phosphatase [Bacteroidales bacterium]|nr:SpoIIE family protein phosphatase [Bacteroidales bacterium]
MFRIVVILYFLIFIFSCNNIVTTKTTHHSDTLLITNIFKKADSLKKCNNTDSSINYYIQLLHYSLPYFIKTGKCENYFVSSIEYINKYFVEKGKPEIFAQTINTLLPFVKQNTTLKLMVISCLISYNDFFRSPQHITFLKEVIHDLLKQKEYSKLAKLFLSIGNCFYSNFDFEKALTFYQLSYTLFKKINDTIGLSKVLNNFSLIQIELKNYKDAEKLLFESLSIKEKNNDIKGKAFVYGNLSMIYSEYALKYLENNIDSANYYKNKALYYSSLSLKIDSLYSNEKGVIETILNEATLHSDFKEFSSAQKKYEIIKNYIQKHPDEKDIQLFYLINSSDFDILVAQEATLSANQNFKYLNQAKQKILKAYDICKNYGYDSYSTHIFSQLYTVNKLLGNYKDALHYLELEKMLKDSLLNIEKINYLSKLDKQFQTKQQQEKIIYLEKERNWLNNQRKLIIIFSIVLLTLSFIVIYQIYKRLIVTRKQNNIITNQKNRIEQIHKELIRKNELIEQSIRYTKNIQESFLINEQDLKKYFTDCFILYLPKEHLSGDFYLFKNTEKYYYLIVGDCAGHGIPGAMMSFVATSFIMQFLSSKDNWETDELLSQLHYKLYEFQTQRSADITESTEISLLRYDTENKIVSISSTNQEVFLFIDKQLVIFEPDIQSVGQCIGLNNPISFSFKKINYSFNTSCKIFLSTDGIYDEYNHSEKKRYGKNRFIEVIQSLSYEPLMVAKKTLLREHANWKGDSTQTDDITIIGIEI